MQEIEGLKLLEEIGRGAESVVYRAAREGQVYAVKVRTASAGTDASAALLRFRREAGILGRLRHPALVQVAATGESGGLPYLVMEYVQGQNLGAQIQGGKLSGERTAAIARTIAAALAEVHHHGLVHRDVKPENILIGPDGAARLIDFGLAVAASAEPQQGRRSAEAVGTFLYSAPEQTGFIKRPVDGRSDLYSLGVVMFHCITGEPPFSAPDVGELIRRHGTEQPRPLRGLAPEASSALEQIVAKLLAKDPDDRYQSADALLEALEHLPELEGAGAGAVAVHRTQARGPSAEAGFVGRTSELERLDAVLAQATTGRGGVVLVEGEAGIGKSRLLDEWSARIAATDTLVLRARCSRSAVLPAAALREVIEHLIDELERQPDGLRRQSEEQLRSAAGRFAPVLAQLTPRLARILGEVETQPSDGAQELFYDGLIQFLLALGRSRKAFALVVDDGQWLDSASRNVLRRLCSQLPSSNGVLVLAGARDAQLEAFAGSLAEVLPSISTLHLDGLNERAVAELAASWLGGMALGPDLVAQLALRANGQPWILLELLRAMLEQGSLQPSWGRWILTGKGLEGISLSNRVAELITQRLEGVPPPLRRILEAGAVLGGSFSAELLGRIVGQPRELLDAALADAIGLRLLARGRHGGEFVFVHERIREALLSEADPGALRGWHQSAAEALDASSGDGLEELLALGRHYGLGEVEKNPKRVYETNLRAGQAAAGQFADAEARSFLLQAERSASAAGIRLEADFHLSLGTVLSRMGELSQAAVQLQAALEKTSDRRERARIRMHLSRVHNATFSTASAWAELERAFAELGFGFSSTRPLRVLVALGWALFGLLLKRFGVWSGRAKNSARQVHQTIAELCEYGAFLAAVHGRPLAMMQMALRPLYDTQLLGPGRAQALAFANFSVLLSVMKKVDASARAERHARQLAQELGDPYALGRTGLWTAWAHEFRGDTRGSEELARVALEQYGTWLEAGDYWRGCTALGWNLLMRGYTREAAQYVERARIHSELTSGQAGSVHGHPHLSYAGSLLAVSGQGTEGAEKLRKARHLAEQARDERYRWGHLLAHTVLFCVEQDELGEPLEKALAEHRALGMAPGKAPFHLRHFYVFAGYARAAQCLAPGEPRADARARLEEALVDLRAAAQVPTLQSHRAVIEAVACWVDGKDELAAEHLVEAERLARLADSPWALFESGVLRARMLRKAGDLRAASREAAVARQLAVQHGWVNRARRLERDFQLEASSRGGGEGAANRTRFASSNATSASFHQLERHLNALLRVSLASANVLDPDALAALALDEIIKVLGADRAYLFLCREGGDELEFKVGRDSSGQALTKLVGYSSTIVQRVRMTREPLVVSGTEEGAVLGSQSAVAHDLRSIIASPIQLNGRLIGVVYLDSQFARGIFTDEDVDILAAIANHIAAALETARGAQLELQRQAVEKDLAVTAAVQSLFLPREASAVAGPVRLEGSYRSAQQCGGDWWSYERLGSGGLRLLLGDVTGHGTASAMVTAAVAATHRTSRLLQEDADVEQLLATSNRALEELASGQYRMTMSAVELHADGRLEFWSAAAPPILVAHDGKISAETLLGTPLGSGELFLGRKTLQLQPGDRVLVFTDGIPELVLSGGRALGLRGLKQLFTQTLKLPLDEARQQLVRGLDELRGEQPVEDDMTFIVLEWNPT